MANMWSRIRKGSGENVTESRLSVQDWADQWFSFNGNQYPLVGQGWAPSSNRESIGSDFGAYVQGAYKSSGIVFACCQARMLPFSEMRFQYRKEADGRPGDLFDAPELSLLENPWPNGTTGELLARAMQDTDFAGNHYVVKEGVGPRARLRRLRPDWVDIMLSAPPDEAVQSDVVGYLYYPGGDRKKTEPRFYPADGSQGAVAHWSPIPDPEAQYRGMSWLTPVLREVKSDKAAGLHKEKFFSQGATPQLAVSLKDTVTHEQFQKFMQTINESHNGVDNAYKCLHPTTEVAMWDGRLVAASDVRVGDVVVAWADGKAVPGRVSAVEVQPDSPIVTVTTRRGRVIRTNDRHPFLARRVVGGRAYYSDESWFDAAALRPGDILTTGLNWTSDDVADSLTAHESWTLGQIIGDGCTVSSTPVLSAWDAGIRDRVSIGYELRSTGKGHDYRVLGVRSLCVQHGLMGKRAWEKRVPEAVFVGSRKVKAAFVSGLIDADGHVSDPQLRSSAEVGITSTSRGLLADVQHVLASIGVNSTVSLSMPKRGNRMRDCYRLIVLGNEQAALLFGLLDLAHSEKSYRLGVYASSAKGNRRFAASTDRVATVELGASEPTIGIEVEGAHTHVTGGVVTHNTLYLGGGADVSVVGQNMQQMDFRVVQGQNETRVAAAARVPPMIVGFSEGNNGQLLAQQNLEAAKDLFGSGTLRPLWRSLCAAYSVLVPQYTNARLWYDDRDITFLQQDRKVVADLQAAQSLTIARLVMNGFTPQSSTDAVVENDWRILEHTGLFSVQLLPPDKTGETAKTAAPVDDKKKRSAFDDAMTDDGKDSDR